MAHIEPSSFDVIVLGSGLVECLLASALTRAGKSVLLLDQTDVYGSDFASYTIAGLMGSSDLAVNPHAVQPSEASEQVQLPEGVCAFNVARPALPMSGLETLSRPGTSIGNERSYILDLAPKVIYQAEHLVDVLLRTRAHNYLEFKAVDCSLILQGGVLSRVPASRAEVFKDKKLGLADKRQLMAFISAAMDGAQGLGRLAAALASTQPLTDVLASEGLNPGLAAIVLYGIAMAWSTQSQKAAGTSAAGAGTSSASAETERSSVSASQGAAMLALFTSSLGKFGSQGAFMFPSYGCGSVPEALVRHSAVHGAVTALRQPVSSILVGPRSARVLHDTPPADGTQPSSTGDSTTATGGGGTAEGAASSTDQPITAATASEARQDAQADAPATSLAASSAQAGSNSCSTVVQEEEDDVVPVVRGILCEGGQVLECKEALVAGARTLRPLLQGIGCPLPPVAHLARAVVVLDGPLAAAESMSTLVIPPGSQGVENAEPIQGLLLSPSSLVCPQHKWLLYLSTPLAPIAAGTPQSRPSARDTLLPALSLLADCEGLQGAGADAEAANSPAPVSSTGNAQADPSASTSAPTPTPAPPAAPTTGAELEAPRKPTVLRVFFYTQELCLPSHIPSDAGALLSQIWEPSPGTASPSQDPRFAPSRAAHAAFPGLPQNVVLCPTSDPSLFGYVEPVAAAEALVKAHFPGVTWLGDLPRPGEAGAEEAAGRGGEDEDAIDDLTAALQALAGQTGGTQTATEN